MIFFSLFSVKIDTKFRLYNGFIRFSIVLTTSFLEVDSFGLSHRSDDVHIVGVKCF